ncbi:hypothetical protein ACL02U_08255 [Streptomyces sp. MS06]|uniref:hypothetical protein n=1 Tax=Streptomyces sp. MS06 TaxID=3385974 RepID=UPI0039A1E999
MDEEKSISRTVADIPEAAEEPAAAPPERTARLALRRPDRAALITAAAVLAACTGLVLYGVPGTAGGGDQGQQPVVTASVTYEVTGSGTADLTYQAGSEAGEAVVVRGARLPWRKTVDVPLGQHPTINILLGADGGTARCSLAVRGRHLQSATAGGTFGRTTCSAAPLTADSTGTP